MSAIDIQDNRLHSRAFLFDQESEVQSNSCVVAIETIKLSRQQPRHYFDPQKQAALADSIRQHGILEPLLVRPLNSATSKLLPMSWLPESGATVQQKQ